MNTASVVERPPAGDGAVLEFDLPPELETHEPIERHGRRRDDVRLVVAAEGDGSIAHHCFTELPGLLRPGDLLVVNTSATLPAAAPARRAGHGRALVHFATPAAGGLWVVELRQPVPGGNRPLRDAARGETVVLDAGGSLTLVAPLAERPDGGVRLWLAEPALGAPVEQWLGAFGRPIRYADTDPPVPLADYQTVFARPSGAGSAEMPSAGRPFTAEVVSDLVSAGVLMAPLVLHAGVSSLEDGERPPAERYEVPEATAALANHVHDEGGRIIAVGTTVVRALETVVDSHGRAHPGRGWTELVLGPERPARLVDGLITGWHEPRSSHLRLLEAVSRRDVLERSYAAALAARYHWHEFGDLHLLLP
jgi:S-adenosylmethionine:tRNA ribosyltransferase-isomerase